MYFQYAESRYEYTGKGSSKVYHVYHYLAFEQTLTETYHSVSFFRIQVEFDTISDALLFQLVCDKSFCKNNEQIVAKLAPVLNERAETILLAIVELVLSSPIIHRKVQIIYQLRYMDFSGSYSFGGMSVDFGKHFGDFQDRKLCLCEFPYEVICIKKNDLLEAPSFDNAFESVEQYKQLLQFFLRAPLEEYDSVDFELEKLGLQFENEKGKESNEELCLNSILPYTSFERNHPGLPSDLHRVFLLFEKLPYKYQSVFLDCCSMYAKALIASSNEAISYFVIILENLCKKLHPDVEHSHDRFKTVFLEYSGSLDQKDSLQEKYYAVRCSYAHDAVVSQNTYQRALAEVVVSKKDVLIMEKIVYIAMISWMEQVK